MQNAIAKLFEISSTSSLLSSPSSLKAAQQLQVVIARGDATIATASIAGTKYLLEKIYGYGGNPRRPLPPIDQEKGEKLWAHVDVRDLLTVENQLAGVSAISSAMIEQ